MEWFFLVWALGAHNGHSFTSRVVVDRIVMPTKNVCEAARRGIEEYAVGEQALLYNYSPGPCEPLLRGPRTSPTTPCADSSATPGRASEETRVTRRSSTR